jgi:hypothetical protein
MTFPLSRTFSNASECCWMLRSKDVINCWQKQKAVKVVCRYFPPLRTLSNLFSKLQLQIRGLQRHQFLSPISQLPYFHVCCSVPWFDPYLLFILTMKGSFQVMLCPFLINTAKIRTIYPSPVWDTSFLRCKGWSYDDLVLIIRLEVGQSTVSGSILSRVKKCVSSPHFPYGPEACMALPSMGNLSLKRA